MPKKPKRLSPGGHIRLLAPAGIVDLQKVHRTQELLTRDGYTVSQGAHLFATHEIFAGDDQSRAQDLLDALSDPDVDAIFFARGGYGSVRLLPHLDRTDLSVVAPKCLLGYSDITVLHAYFQSRYDWVTFHGPVGESDWLLADTRIALAVLSGMQQSWDAQLEVFNPVLERIVAPWRGGNLTVLTSLVGTPYIPDLAGCVLFLEEVNEAPYRIDRMLRQLLLAGCLSRIQGIVWGEAVSCGPEANGFSVRTVLREVARALGVPCWYGFPAGHGLRNWTIPLGQKLRIDGNQVVVVSA